MKLEKFNKSLLFLSKIYFSLIYFIYIFNRECITKFGDILGKEIWDGINSVFDVLPFAAVIDDTVYWILLFFVWNLDLLINN